MPEDYSDMGAMVARYDSPHWVVFNRGTGAKVRLTFTTCPPGPYQDNPVTEDTLKARKFLKGPQVEVTKAAAPELVDIKITDYCPFGCKYCYQGSTAKGTHAKTDTINTLSYALGRMHVFEVALGGGEPTNLHEVLDAKNALGLPDAYRMVMSDLRARAASGVRDVAVEEALGALDALNSAKVS